MVVNSGSGDCKDRRCLTVTSGTINSQLRECKAYTRKYISNTCKVYTTKMPKNKFTFFNILKNGWR